MYIYIPYLDPKSIYSYKECGEDLNRNPVQVNIRVTTPTVVHGPATANTHGIPGQSI